MLSPNSRALLKFQIGPVQDFIAAARSTRDLWSGSYLLSWLAAVGIRKAMELGSEVVFPGTGRQPLLQRLADGSGPDLPEGFLTPNLTNLFLLELPEAALRDTAREVERAIRDEWSNIAKAVWEVHEELQISSNRRVDFFRQADRHLTISWQGTPVPSLSAHAYREACQMNDRLLDGVRQIRDFEARGQGTTRVDCEKDALTAREESILDGATLLNLPEAKQNRYTRLFKHADHVGAITLIKRLWHLAYFNAEDHPSIRKCLDKQRIRSVPAIAARRAKLDTDDTSALEGEVNSIAAIAMDGDSIGSWMSGTFLPDRADLLQHQRAFSEALSQFALQEVPGIVGTPVQCLDPTQSLQGTVPLGHLIYAGGDDVVALVPADSALACAAELRAGFLRCTSGIQGRSPEGGAVVHPEVSAGIAIAHALFPLQELIRQAQSAQKRAKNEVGRPAFSVTLMKRSGAITRWGAQWTSHGLELGEAMADLMSRQALSGKFPHRVCELLEPYLTHPQGQSLQDRKSPVLREADDFPVREVILSEFGHVVRRQSASGSYESNHRVLLPLLEKYLDAIIARQRELSPAPVQTLLCEVIGLCTTVAFTHRTSRESSGQVASLRKQ